MAHLLGVATHFAAVGGRRLGGRGRSDRWWDRWPVGRRPTPEVSSSRCCTSWRPGDVVASAPDWWRWWRARRRSGGDASSSSGPTPASPMPTGCTGPSATSSFPTSVSCTTCRRPREYHFTKSLDRPDRRRPDQRGQCARQRLEGLDGTDGGMAHEALARPEGDDLVDRLALRRGGATGRDRRGRPPRPGRRSRRRWSASGSSRSSDRRAGSGSARPCSPDPPAATGPTPARRARSPPASRAAPAARCRAAASVGEDLVAGAGVDDDGDVARSAPRRLGSSSIPGQVSVAPQAIPTQASRWR